MVNLEVFQQFTKKNSNYKIKTFEIDKKLPSMIQLAMFSIHCEEFHNSFQFVHNNVVKNCLQVLIRTSVRLVWPNLFIYKNKIDYNSYFLIQQKLFDMSHFTMIGHFRD